MHVVLERIGFQIHAGRAMLDLVLAAAFHSSVPFSLVDNRIVVSARINGKSGYAMIVDTGASGVLITPSAARSLHIRGAGRARERRRTRVERRTARNTSELSAWVVWSRPDDRAHR